MFFISLQKKKQYYKEKDRNLKAKNRKGFLESMTIPADIAISFYKRIVTSAPYPLKDDK